MKFVDPKLTNGGVESGHGPGGFVREPGKFMVTDDLVVTPLSSLSVISFLQKSKIPFASVEENMISITAEEAKRILHASLHSTSALTDGLSHILPRTSAEETKPKLET